MASDLLITADKLAARLDEPDLAVFDCRFRLDAPEACRAEYLASHVAGAVYAHLDEGLSGPRTATGSGGRHPLPSAGAITDQFSRWGIGPTTTVVAYDEVGGGLAAARLWWLLRYMGHRRAVILDGGWQAWVSSGGPLRAGEERRAPARFTGTPNPGLYRDADFVEWAARTPGWVVVDSRLAARYRGDEEPIDPVAGHIPGARNYCWQENVDSEWRMLAPARLRAKLDQVLGGARPDRAIFYCGSGVTSAFQVFAMEVAGLAGGLIYAGSWSEWCRDPGRPIATGDRP